MATIKQLEREIKIIKERNRRVEVDKAWETSAERKIVVSLLTYMVVVVFFIVAGLPRPFINAIVPVVAFSISTLTVSAVKRIWVSGRK